MASTAKLRPNVLKAMEDIKNDPAFQPIKDPPLRPIVEVQFGILSPDEIKAMAVCTLIESRVANPPIGTVYDARMGPSSTRGSLCATCTEDIRKCPGHYGQIELVRPIVNPNYFKYIVSILNCICLKCSKLKMSSEEIDLEINVLEEDRFIRFIDKLNIIVKKCGSVAFCTGCNYPHPDIKEINGNICKVYDSIERRGIKKPSIIEVEDLRLILTKISINDLKIMGFQPLERTIMKHGKIPEKIYTFRPEWLIITHLPVISPIARPPANEGDNRSDDDLTTSYTDIIKYNERLKDPTLKEMAKANMMTLLQKHIGGLFDNSSGAVTRSSGKVAKGIKERISGKGGHIRGKLMGKRVDNSARTVITADPKLRLNEVGVPESIAQTLSFPEKVTARNLKEITELLEQDKINTIVRGFKLIRVHLAKEIGRVLKLKIGDIAYRQLRDGDTIVFNRQPTLHRGGMMAHYIRVLPGKTFRLNLSVTKPYNADFDGDEMQLHVPQDYGSVIEVQSLMGVNKMIVSSQASKPIMGVIQDALLGSYLMTKPNVNIPRHQFMDCVYSAGEEYINRMPGLLKQAEKHYKNVFCGRVLFSILLPIDFQYNARNNICKDEPNVIIVNGLLIAGTVDSKIIGNAHGSIGHRLYKEYNSDRAAEFLSVVQFLVNRWLTYRGFSVGMADYLISSENTRGVRMAIQKAYLEVESIEKSGDSKALKEFRINGALNNRGQSLAINGLCPDNRLETMIESGSKGSKMNIIQITGHLGQNNVEGKRVQCEIDDGSRTLPCFKRGDTGPKTRGFIENSFMTGLAPHEFFFHAKAGREGVINTAVSTKETGYAQRKLGKRMEGDSVNVDQSVRNSSHHIIDFSYGDGLDPTMVYNNNGPSFVDIDNLVSKLNADPEPEEDFEYMQKINTVENKIELKKQIDEYTLTIETLKKKTGPIYKSLLSTAQEKLKQLQQEYKKW
jgi:DNA-directed RNA polymerase II subunit RPB1